MLAFVDDARGRLSSPEFKLRPSTDDQVCTDRASGKDSVTERVTGTR
jgi:hypothetical protein